MDGVTLKLASSGGWKREKNCVLMHTFPP